MDRSELETLTAEQLTELLETSVSEFRWNRTDAYKALLKKHGESGDTQQIDNVKREILAFDLYVHRPSEARFSPMMSGTTDQEESWKYPDLEKNFPEESIEYYKTRAYVTANPIPRARYSDIVWELQKDVAFARLAVTAYLDSCPIYFANEWDPELADSLDRALAIALMISEQPLIDKALASHYDFIKQLLATKRFRYVHDITQSLLKQERKLGARIDYDRLTATLQDIVDDYARNIPDSFHIQRQFLELIARIWQIGKNQTEFKNTTVSIAQSFVEEAEWKKTRYPNGNMVAARLYEKALRAYLDIGGFPEKAEELKTRIQQANEAALKTEYKILSGKVEIPREKIDDYLRLYRGHTSVEILQIMSRDTNLIPSYAQSRAQAIEQAKKFVFQHLMPVVLTRGNIVVKHVSGDDEKLESATIRNLVIRYRTIAHVLLTELFALLQENDPEYVDSLAKHLSSSRIIDSHRLALIQHGLRAFKNEEYVAAIHILIFQIEGALRDLLAKLALPTFSYRSNEMREKMLQNVLVMLSNETAMDKDLLKFIEVFLCDIRGDNYRNDVAHGLVTVEKFTRTDAQLLILIKIASYTIVKKANAGLCEAQSRSA